MLIRELDDALDGEAMSHATPIEVGSTCRVCPRTDCAARREATILSAGVNLSTFQRRNAAVQTCFA